VRGAADRLEMNAVDKPWGTAPAAANYQMQEEAGSARDAKRQCTMRQTLSVHTAYCVYCPSLRHEGGDNKNAALSKWFYIKFRKFLSLNICKYKNKG